MSFNEVQLQTMIHIWKQYFPYKRGIVTLNKSVIKYLPRCTDHLLYNVMSKRFYQIIVISLLEGYNKITLKVKPLRTFNSLRIPFELSYYKNTKAECFTAICDQNFVQAKKNH